MVVPCGRTCVARSTRESATPVGHWECDTVISAAHNQAIVTVVERKSGYEVMAKVSNQISDLVVAAIIEALNPLKTRVNTFLHIASTLQEFLRNNNPS